MKKLLKNRMIKIRTITLSCVVILAMSLSSCVSLYSLTPIDYQDIIDGKETLVLLRVQSFVDNDIKQDAFPCSKFKNPLVSFGIGSFRSVGEPKFTVNKYFTDESCKAGWTFFLLSPGLYYLSVYGPASTVPGDRGDLAKAPRWLVDIPDKAQFAYIGTYIMHGKIAGKLMFGEKIIEPQFDDVAVINEYDRAVDILSHYISGADLKIINPKRWYPGEPILIRTPKDELGKITR